MNEKGVGALSRNVGDVEGEAGESLARTQDEGALAVRRGQGRNLGRHWTP